MEYHLNAHNRRQWLAVTLFTTLIATTAPFAHAQKAAPAPSWTEGVVKKINTQASSVTIEHGYIANIEMPPMTMAFKARDPALLAKVKVGDKVRFTAEAPDGAMYLTGIERLK